MCTKDIALKAACADNFYHPPDWNPSSGSLDEFQRKKGFEHHLGAYRTKNLNKGILIIRFEMPFKVQCLRCQTYIGQGTRYDADKKKVDKYFTTPIYEFMMRCCVPVGHEKSVDGSVYCNQRFVIRTDPQAGDYKLVEGIRRKVETWDIKDAETLDLPDPETRRQMDSDPMVKAEKTIRNKQREKSQKEQLANLIDLQDDNHEDDYALNCILRRGNRERRKQEQAEADEAAKRPPPNFGFPLLDAAPSDVAEAKAIEFRTDHDRVDTAVKRAALKAAPLLKSSGPALHGGEIVLKRPRRDTGQASAAELVALAVKRQKLAQHAKMERLFSKKQG